MADVFAIRYSTKYFDSETGLYYYTMRYYSPELMRWITRDPIGDEGGVNLYVMCGNAALVNFDALGEFKVNYYTKADTSFLERVRTVNLIKYIPIKNENELYVEEVNFNLNGMFSDSVYYFSSDCEFNIVLWIMLSDNLLLSANPSDEFVTMPHKNTSDGYSIKRGGGRPLKGGVLAHEKGHAKAFFDYQKPMFESKIASLVSKNKLTDAEQEQVKKAYKEAKKAIVPHGARLANEAEQAWYASNGFTVSNKEGLYVYKKNK